MKSEERRKPQNGNYDCTWEGPPRWPFALQAMQWVAIETPTPISVTIYKG